MVMSVQVSSVSLPLCLSHLSSFSYMISCIELKSNLFMTLLLSFVCLPCFAFADATCIHVYLVIFWADRFADSPKMSNSKRLLQTSQYPCQSMLGTYKRHIAANGVVPSSRSKFGNWTTVPLIHVYS